MRKLLVVAAVVLVSGVLFVSGAPAPAPTGYDGRTREVIDRMLKNYASLTAYEDVVVASFEVESSDPKMAAPTQPAPPVIFKFVRPNRVVLQAPNYALFSDGRRMWQYLPEYEQYIATDAPAKIQIEELPLAQMQVMDFFPHPVVPLIMNPESAGREFLAGVGRFTGLRKQDRAGRGGWLVTWLSRDEGEENAPAVPVQAWITDAGFVEELRYDYTQRVQQDLEASVEEGQKAPEVRRYVTIFKFTKIKANEPAAQEAFTFKPRSGDEQVTEFVLDEARRQLKLVHRPAPDFTARTLDGRKVNLADLKGKVVLLDFWATWCAPCVKAMPELQKLADVYGKQGVAIYGVNGEGTETDVPVDKFLQQHQIRYPQLDDTDSSLAEAYRVAGIPCLVMIDQKGIIQAIHVGYRPGDEKQIRSEIDQLLAGKGLPKPKPPETTPSEAGQPAERR